MFGVSFLQAVGSYFLMFWCLPPVGKVGSAGCVGFLLEGTGALFWWVVLDLVFLVGRAASNGVFWGAVNLV